MSIPERVRLEVWDRSDGICEIGGPRCVRRASEVDHIVARGMGGRKGAAKKANNDPSNYRAVCIACHRERHDGGRVYA